MLVYTGFTYCPRCGRAELEAQDTKGVRCTLCGFIFYHNTAAAAAVIIESTQGILLVRRSRAPQAGMLDLPGGFVDYAESAETAVIREVHEELGVELTGLRYLGSYPNRYVYRDVTYFTADTVFTARLVVPDEESSPTPVLDPEEVTELVIIRAEDLNLEEIAFQSMRSAIEDYLKLCAR